MMSNNYELSLGKQGYLAIDLAGGVGSNVNSWASSTMSSNPNILNCYGTTNAESCYAPGATYTDPTDHEQALANMLLMD